VTDDEQIELARDPLARKREVGDRDHALARADIVDRQDAKPPAAVELIGDKVEHPQIVRLRRLRGRASQS